jgi:hypothetical protein
MDSESQFDDIYQKLSEARLLDIEIIMEIEAWKYGVAYKEAQVGYDKLLRRCRGVLELKGIEISDGRYQRKLKKLSDPEIPVKDKPFVKDNKNGKYNINFVFIEKDVEQRSKGLIRILPPGAGVVSDSVVFEVRDAEGRIKKVE